MLEKLNTHFITHISQHSVLQKSTRKRQKENIIAKAIHCVHLFLLHLPFSVKAVHLPAYFNTLVHHHACIKPSLLHATYCKQDKELFLDNCCTLTLYANNMKLLTNLTYNFYSRIEKLKNNSKIKIKSCIVWLSLPQVTWINIRCNSKLVPVWCFWFYLITYHYSCFSYNCCMLYCETVKTAISSLQTVNDYSEPVFFIH